MESLAVYRCAEISGLGAIIGAVEHEYSDAERRLLRRALSPAPTSALLMLKVQAISDLAGRGVPRPVERIRAELESVR